MMIIYLTKTSGGKVAVHFSMVTYVEEYSDHCEVHFPYSYISVKETLDEIKLLVDIKRTIDCVLKG